MLLHSFDILAININLYGVLMGIGFLVAFLIVYFLYKKKKILKPEITFDLLLIVFPLSILGARLYYVIFSAESFSFIEFWQIWNGGLAIYGGIIGGFLGLVLYSVIKKINLFKITDAVAVGLIIAQGIGRIGCYFGGCCYGIEVTNPELMWFPFSVLIDGVWHYSTFFYEAIWNFIGFVLLFIVYNKTERNGLTTGIYLSFYGLGRFFIEGLRGDSLYIFSLKVSQVLSVILFATGIIIAVMSFVQRKGNKNEQKSTI